MGLGRRFAKADPLARKVALRNKEYKAQKPAPLLAPFLRDYLNMPGIHKAVLFSL